MRISGFAKIIFGLILIYVNISWEGVDIVPDFLGFLMIISGLSSLTSLHRSFYWAKRTAIVLAALSLMTMFLGILKHLILPNQVNFILIFLLAFVMLAFHVTFTILFGQGLVYLLEQKDLSEDAQITKNCINVNVVMIIFSFVVVMIQLFASAEFLLVTLSVALAILAANIWLLVRIYQTAKALNEGQFTFRDDFWPED